jgi:hypothetical protein
VGRVFIGLEGAEQVFWQAAICKKAAESSAAFLQKRLQIKIHLTSTEICFGFVAALFGRMMVRIPLSQAA